MRKTHGIITAVLIAGTVADGHAQTRQMEMRLDSLARIAARTRDAVRVYDDSVRSMARTMDTAYAGTPVVVAERQVVAEVRAIAPVIVDSVTSAVGSSISRLAGYAFRIHVERVAWGRGGDTTSELVVSVLRPNGTQTRAWRAPVDSAELSAALHRAISYAAFTAVDPDFFAWAGNAIPGDTLRASDWANQRLLLVSAPTAVGGRCYRGDKEACRIALLLSPESDPVLQWHDSTTRRRLVRRHAAMARRMDARAEQQCLEGADAACITLLQLFPGKTFGSRPRSASASGFCGTPSQWAALALSRGCWRSRRNIRSRGSRQRQVCRSTA